MSDVIISPSAQHSFSNVSNSVPSNITYGPPISYKNNSNIDFSNINNSFIKSGRYSFSARELSDSFNDYYMNYNKEMYNTARDYDMYMSNSAIQRQVEDLKKAGLNPILAARLGGAQYKGVNAPYLSISPSSALNSYLDYESSMYQADLQANTQLKIENMKESAEHFINSYNRAIDYAMQKDLFNFEFDKIKVNFSNEKNRMQYENFLNKDLMSVKYNFDSLLENVKNLGQQVLSNLGFKHEKDLIEYKYEIDFDYEKLKNAGTTNENTASYYLSQFVDKIYKLIPGAKGLYH